MPAHQEQTAAGGRTARESGSQAEEGAGPRAFRSPFAVLIWWVWVLFALGNLIDLAVQGRDHSSVVAAFILLARWRPPTCCGCAASGRQTAARTRQARAAR